MKKTGSKKSRDTVPLSLNFDAQILYGYIAREQLSAEAGSLKMNTALEYSTRVVQEGGRRCKKSTLNDFVHLTPLRIPLMNPPLGSGPRRKEGGGQGPRGDGGGGATT